LLPLESGTYHRRRMTARLDATPSSPLVLVVEDDAETRQFYSAAFERDGFLTEHAHNGHQALANALDRPPDLILTDIAVPGLDGIELAGGCAPMIGRARFRCSQSRDTAIGSTATAHASPAQTTSSPSRATQRSSSAKPDDFC
jgi:CheY-like chemotaxis protein